MLVFVVQYKYINKILMEGVYEKKRSTKRI